MTVDIVFYAVFIASKVGKAGLTPTIDVDQITRSDGTRSALVTDGNAIEGRNGFYYYRLAAADLQLYDYVATFKTSDATVDAQHIHALWSSFPAAYATELARLDAAISSRLASASYTTPPTVGAVADQVWDEALSGHVDAGSAGDALGGVEAGVWAYATRTLTQAAASSSGSTTADVTRRRGDSWSIAITGLGALTGYTSIWFTLKMLAGDTDAQSTVQIKKNASGVSDGLLYVNGAAAADASKGSITVDDAVAGNITIALDETITDDLAPSWYMYDIQTLISGSVNTPENGSFEISADTTRSVV